MDVTITSEGASETHQVCLTYEPHIVLLSQIITTVAEADLTFIQAECECNWEDQNYDNVDECVEDRIGDAIYQQYLTWCIDQAYTVYERPMPAGFEDFLACNTEQVEESVSCVDILDGGQACETEDFDAYDNCREDESSNQCEEDLQSDEEGAAWFSDFVNFFDLYCGVR